MLEEVSATCHVPHGVVFVYDPALIVDVPDDTGTGPVLATSNCISLWTADEDSGPVTLVLTHRDQHDGYDRIFDGAIATSGRLAFNRSDCTPIIEATVPEGSISISIYANDMRFPSKLVCVVERNGPPQS